MTAMIPLSSAPATAVPMVLCSSAKQALRSLPSLESIPAGCFAQVDCNTGLYVVIDPARRDMVDGMTVAIRWHEHSRQPSISELRHYPDAKVFKGWHVRAPFVPEGNMAMVDQIHPTSWQEHGVGHVIGVLCNRDGSPMTSLWGDQDGHSAEAIPAECWPPNYCSMGMGDCLEPVYSNGTRFQFSSTDTPEAGDFVVLWRKPRLTGAGQYQAMIKRLVSDLPDGWDDPEREWAAPPAVVVETLNPRRSYVVRLDEVTAVHKCLGEYTGRVTRWSRAETIRATTKKAPGSSARDFTP